MLFSLFAPVVEVVSLEGDRIVLRSSRRLRSGLTRVRSRLVDAELEMQKLELRVEIEQSRPDETGRYTSTGSLRSPLPFASALPPARTPRRDAPRVNLSARVISKALPSFCALALDLSRTGMQVVTYGKVAVGQTIELRLEADLEWESVALNARVAWSAIQGPRSYRVGLQFVDLTEEARQRLEELEIYLVGRETISLEHRALERADLLLLGS